MTKTIELTRGQVALVDDDLYPLVAKFKWYAAKRGHTYYAVRGNWNKGRQKQVYMHRTILPVMNDEQVDHINHNGLDNRLCNLRVCKHAQNQQNMLGWGRRKSRFKGVHKRPDISKWSASICEHGKTKHLGYFATEEAAALAYNEAATSLWGDFACLNEITDCGYLAENPTALGPSILDLSVNAFSALSPLSVGVLPVEVWLR